MKMLSAVSVALALSALTLWGQTSPPADLAALRAAYAAERAAIEAEAQPKLDAALQAYLEGISALQQKKMIARKVEEAMALKKESERMAKGMLPGDVPSTASMEWRTLASTYAKQAQAARQPLAIRIRSARAAHLQKLGAAERALTAQPEASALEAVRWEKMCVAIEAQLEARGTVSTADERHRIEVPSSGGLLVGYNIGEGGYNGRTIIKSIQPIFRTGAGEQPGAIYGDGPRRKNVVAPPGYAVGALLIKTGDRLEGLSITFMKVVPEKLALDPKNTKGTDWIGGTGGGQARQVGGNGRLAVGSAIKSGSDIDGIGLVNLR